MLAIEAPIRLLPRYWHKVKGLEELVKEGRLYLPEILLSNALRSIKDEERGWSTNKFCNMINMIYSCPGGNNKTFHSPKLQNKHGPIQCSINEGYFTGFDFQFIGEYPLKSRRAHDWCVGSIHSITLPIALPMPVPLLCETSMMLLIGRYRPSSSLWAGRSFAGEIALVSRSSSRLRFDAFPMLPTSNTTHSQRPRHSSVVDVPMGSADGPVASSATAEDTSFVPFVHRTGSSLVS